MSQSLVVLYSIGGTCACISLIASIHLLAQHFWHFSKPDYQMYICRIILMVPVYGITSWISMLYPANRAIFNIFRDCYEAFVLYSFTMLLMNYVGGERKLIISLELKDRISHPWPFNWFFKSFTPGSMFIRLVKAGTLQFVLFRPLSSALTLLFEFYGIYHENAYNYDDSFLYLFALNNVSFSLALYGLLLFYVSTEEMLEPYKPLPKFLCIKIVIFFSFWQGILINILQQLGFINETVGLKPEEVAITLQEFLICIEMLIAAFAHMFAFGYEEYTSDVNPVYLPIKSSVASGIKSVFLAEDVIKEVKDSINPVTYDFELHN